MAELRDEWRDIIIFQVWEERWKFWSVKGCERILKHFHHPENVGQL
ncbi:hypothetical protein [Rhizobium etli]|nr:hypothetical protein [Rhizobium etli]